MSVTEQAPQFEVSGCEPVTSQEVVEALASPQRQSFGQRVFKVVEAVSTHVPLGPTAGRTVSSHGNHFRGSMPR